MGLPENNNLDQIREMLCSNNNKVVFWTWQSNRTFRSRLHRRRPASSVTRSYEEILVKILGYSIFKHSECFKNLSSQSDVRLKSSPMFVRKMSTNVFQKTTPLLPKSCHISSCLKVIIFKIAKKVAKHLGYVLPKSICFQFLSGIAQSVSTFKVKDGGC